MSDDFPNRLLSARQACVLLGLSLPTLRRMTAARAVPFVRIGSRVLFEPESLQAYIAERRVPSNAAKAS